jgi:ribulose-phosphate 3-epimerase
MTEISVSILNSNFLSLKDSLDSLKNIGISNIHIDVIDTSFADNISFGPGIINQVLQTDFQFELHLMIQNPLSIIKMINLERISSITVHSDFVCIKKHIREIGKNIKVGLAINPDENIPAFRQELKQRLESATEDCLNDETHKFISSDNVPDHILVMTVFPGFGGQSLIEDCIKKIRLVKEQGIKIGVDGGVNALNISLLKDADYIVVGSAITESTNMQEYYSELIKKLC